MSEHRYSVHPLLQVPHPQVAFKTTYYRGDDFGNATRAARRRKAPAILVDRDTGSAWAFGPGHNGEPVTILINTEDAQEHIAEWMRKQR